MDLAVFSNILGILELVIGVPLVLNGKATAKWMNKVLADDIHVRVLGLVLLILGGLVIMDDPNIEQDVDGLMRLVAWICAIKGIYLAWWPEYVVDMNTSWLKNATLALLTGVAAVVFGVLFLYAGSVL